MTRPRAYVSLPSTVSEAIRAILDCFGLPPRAPPVAAAVAEPEEDGIEAGVALDPDRE